jgi:Tfp pilus assembly protein PilV
MNTFHSGLNARRLRQRLRETAVGDPTAARNPGMLGRLAERAPEESGFMLIEVIVSALIVAFIVIATFNGFDAASKATANQRWQSEAELLAAQSQEQLRTEPATALDALESKSHVYTKEVNGTPFSITQEAKSVNAKATGTGCNGTETSKENGANIEIASSVSWPILAQEKRAALKEVSIITPPTGSSLEVNVTNGATTPVSGVTAIATFLPTGGGGFQKAEGTTNSTGCVVLSGLNTTLATVEIPEKANFVTTSGKLQYPPKTISIAPNITTQDGVSYAEGGKITAQFTYEGVEKLWEGKEIKSETFVVANGSIPAAPQWEEGSTAFKIQGTGEEEYEALTGTYAETAATATATKYAFGDLFPFAAPWAVYAGDCPANKPASGYEASGNPLVTQGGNTLVKVPLSRTEVSIWKGSSSANKGSPENERLGPVTITNTGCKSYETPANASGLAWIHEQTQTSLTGHLEEPFQPFGAFTLCMVDKKLAKPKTFTVSYTNSTATGTAPQIYLEQRTEAELATAKSAEATAKATRQTELKAAETEKGTAESELTKLKTAETARVKEEGEAPAKKVAAAATEEATKWTPRKTAEEAEIAKWKKQEETGKPSKLTKAERTAKETAYKLNREKENNNERSARETTENNAKTARVDAEAARPGEEATWKAKKSTAEATITKVGNEETTAAGTREAREKEEGTGVLVEPGEKC